MGIPDDKAHLYFLYCPKLIVFSEDWASVLLARRYGEADYDGMFSFIGGKMESEDEDISAALRREKTEEIGADARLQVYVNVSRDIFWRKGDGNPMIMPHFIARFAGGGIKLNPDEYSEYRWVSVAELDALEPKIANIPMLVAWALQLKPGITSDVPLEI